MPKTEYIIVGDTDTYKGCLICSCGTNETKAKETLNRMVNAPTDADKKLIGDCKNLQIGTINKDSTWWND